MKDSRYLLRGLKRNTKRLVEIVFLCSSTSSFIEITTRTVEKKAISANEDSNLNSKKGTISKILDFRFPKVWYLSTLSILLSYVFYLEILSSFFRKKRKKK